MLKGRPNSREYGQILDLRMYCEQFKRVFFASGGHVKTGGKYSPNVGGLYFMGGRHQGVERHLSGQISFFYFGLCVHK